MLITNLGTFLESPLSLTATFVLSNRKCKCDLREMVKLKIHQVSRRLSIEAVDLDVPGPELSSGRSERGWNDVILRSSGGKRFKFKIMAGKFKFKIMAGKFEFEIMVGKFKFEIMLGKFEFKILAGKFKFEILAGKFKFEIILGKFEFKILAGKIQI
jgi:hypothetical protein